MDEQDMGIARASALAIGCGLTSFGFGLHWAATVGLVLIGFFVPALINGFIVKATARRLP